MESPFLSVEETVNYLRYKSPQTIYNKIYNKSFIEGIHYIKNVNKVLFLKNALDKMLFDKYNENELIDHKESIPDLSKSLESNRAQCRSAINI